MSPRNDDAQAADDFEHMTQLAAQDRHVTAARVLFQQARTATYALFGAAIVCAATAWFSFASWRLETGQAFRIAVIVVSIVTAAAFFGLYLWSWANPLVPSSLGLGLYALLMIPLAAINAALTGMWVVWILQLVVLTGLVDGVRAAFRHWRTVRRALMNERR